MNPFWKKRRMETSLLVAAALMLTGIGCGEDFDNDPREPVSIELTGVIQPQRLTVAPETVGAGPISITISNQTEEAHRVTLEGASVRETVGPINPMDTATLQKTVVQGTYEIRAGGEDGGSTEIRPARLRVGRPREPSNNRVLLP